MTALSNAAGPFYVEMEVCAAIHRRCLSLRYVVSWIRRLSLEHLRGYTTPEADLKRSRDASPAPPIGQSTIRTHASDARIPA